MAKHVVFGLISLLSATADAIVSSPSAEYDFIVAGGGAAGIVAAERLAESGKSVLLLERGPASTYASGGRYLTSWNDSITPYDVPGLSYALRWVNDPPGYCDDTPSPTACLLGGNTMINGLAFVRPPTYDFDSYPEGWKWNDVMAAANRFYLRNPGTTITSTDGQLYDMNSYDIVAAFLRDNGFKSADTLAEPNRKNNTFSIPAYDVQNGLRAGPVMTYLPLAKRLPNFKLSLNTKVIRAVRTNSTITGVEIEANGIRSLINLGENGKLILAAGALSTPRILFNSGIGPSEQIQIVQNGTTNVTLPPQEAWLDLPVGQKIKDHPIVEMLFRSENGSAPSTLDGLSNPTNEMIDAFEKGAGLLTQSYQKLFFWTPVKNTDGSVRYIQGSCNNPADDVISIRLILAIGQTSVGSIGISPDGATVINEDPHLRDDGDKEAMATMIDTMLAWSRRPGSILMYIDGVNSTTTNHTVKGEDLLVRSRSGAHWMGGANLGDVVDLDTKVYGTDNLYIVDATIHPNIPSGNTQAMVMIGAERAAERILAVDGLRVQP